MPIIGAALIPNSPLLLPKLSPLVQRRLAKTKQAIDRLAHELYARQPSLIIIIGYTQTISGVCNLLQAPKLSYSFAEWGDVVTKGEVLIATGFTHSLKERAEVNFPLLLRSVDRLPVNLAVPVNLLSTIFSQSPFVFLELPSSINLDDLTHLSTIIKEHCDSSSERIAIVAVGNLAERITKSKNEAQVYDKYFQAALKPLNQQSLDNLDADLKKRVKETIWAPTLLTAMVVGEIATETEILSYEAPAKVGYIVAQINWL